MASLHDILSDPSATWTRRPLASEVAILALATSCDFTLPEEYLSFLRYSNGGEGPQCLSGWFRLCPAEEVLAYNQGYHVPEYLPGFFAIGNADDELLGIRKRDGSPCPVYLIPFSMDENDVEQIARDIEMFAMALGRS
jgi:hypothetical protein